MTETLPPFDPPYITFFGAGIDAYCIETLTDGTKRPVAMPTKAFQPVVNNSDKKSSGHKEPALKPTSNSTYGDKRAALYLAVPFAEKDNAKNLGAKWDVTKKKWYVPAGLDVNLFNQWWPDDLKNE